MLGLMQQRPLLISSLLDYAERYHAGTEIVSRSVEGPMHRSNWGTIASRAKRVANALRRLGVDAAASGSPRSPGTTIGTWKSTSASPCSGAVLHTVNPRLFPEQVRFIIDDAEASYVFFDLTFAAAGGAACAPAAEGARLRRALRARGAAVASMCRTCSATRSCWRPRPTTMLGRSSTRTARRRCATPPAPPAIPRACCRATAPPCCTASR